jgi:hypothetical protein
MSLDLLVVGFRDGEVRPLRRAVFDAVLRPYIRHSETDPGFHILRTEDGGEGCLYADLDGDDLDGVMFDTATPGQVLDLVAEFARAADAVLVPVGHPTLLLRPGQADHLPEAMRDNTLLVQTGADIDAVLTSY